MKILITNVYSWKNKGDAAIVLSLLDDVRRQFPDSYLAISSTDMSDLNHYEVNEYWPSVLTIFKKKILVNRSVFWGRLRYAYHHVLFRVRAKLFIALSKKRIYPYFLFNDEMATKIRSYSKFDLIIACGGGYLLQPGKLPKIERWLRIHEPLLFAYDFYFARAFSKPYILYNQSIGPFYREKDFRAYLPFLRDANVVLCRESLTYKRLGEAGLKNIRQVADIAFHLADKPTAALSRYIKKQTKIKIGLTVRKWLGNHQQDIYENAIAGFIENVLSRFENAQFFFMPQVHYSVGNDNDFIVSQKIHDKIPKELMPSVHLITEDLHPGELKNLIGQMDYFVGTRMHSNIFALSMGVKTIAIAYEPKTIGIMEDLGLTQYVIPMDIITDVFLVRKFDNLRYNNTYLATLSAGRERLKRLAICNLQNFIR